MIDFVAKESAKRGINFDSSTVDANHAIDDLLLICNAGGTAKEVADYLFHQGLEMLGWTACRNIDDAISISDRLLNALGREP